MPEERAWLVETGTGLYWTGKSLDRLSFSEKVDEALRLSRFQDAEVIKYRLLGNEPYWFAIRSAEHVWIDNLHK